jgi:hypothetical protein
MTRPLSPAAQAVKDAVLALYSDEKVHKFGWQLDSPTVVAALRAAANTMREAYQNEGYVDSPDDLLDDIAAELEADQ